MLLMNWSSLILLICGSLAFQVEASWLTTREKEQLRKSYTKMDQFLSKRSKDPLDMDKNMKLIDKCAKLSFSNIWTGEHPMKEARQRFNRLTTLTENEFMCSSRGYDIISETLRLTRGLPRLRQVVKHFIAKNGEFCEPIFAAIFQQRKEDGLGQDSRKSLYKFTSRMAEELTGWNAEQMEFTLKDVIDGKQDLNLYEFIETKIRNNSKQVDLGKVMVDTIIGLNVSDYSRYIENYRMERFTCKPDEFTMTMIRHIVRPCSLYVEEMNRQKRYQIASVHSRILERNLKFVETPQIYTSNWDLVAFYNHWIDYEICRTFILKDEHGIYKTIKETRLKVLNIDPEDDYPDSHFIQQFPMKFPSSEDYDDVDLFEPNEYM